MRSVQRSSPKCQPGPQLPLPVDDGTVSLAVIQALIPLGLRAVEEALAREVQALAGPRYGRGDAAPAVRWGQQRGSIYLADQKLPIQVPRVRDRAAGPEVPLATYATLQTPRAQDGGLLRRMLSGLSCRDHAAAAEAVPEAFGLAKTTVSRRFIRASARALARPQERPLGQARWVAALVLDGKPFAEDTLVVALGVTATGEKRILGVVQAATENQGVCAACLRELVARGVAADQPRRVVRDGAKGLRAAVREVFGARAQVQRRQWHQRKNVVRYSPKAEKPRWHQRLQDAYAQPTYQETKAQGQRLGRELQLRHVSAPKRLAEGLKETLTLHRLVVQELRTSFKTTNLLESVNARVEARTARVTRWRTSDQKLPRMAAALLVIESRFRRVKGYRQLLLLERALAAKLPETRRRAA